jgi:hypothetical protein
MKRTPVEDIPGRPSCYGFNYSKNALKCQTCKFNNSCNASTTEWQNYESLSQRRERLEKLVRNENETNKELTLLEFIDYYSSQYQRQFGYPAWIGNTPERELDALHKAYHWCKERGIDSATYVNAQMNTMRLWVQNGNQFSARNLCSAAAEDRWNKFVVNGQRIVRSVGVRTFEESTTLMSVLGRLTESEIAVSQIYVSLWQPDFSPEWGICVNTVEVDELWLDTIQNRRYLKSVLGASLPFVRPLIQARAACHHAATFGYLTAANILLQEHWTWSDFCRVLYEISPPVVVKPIDNSAIRWLPELRKNA